MVRRLVINFTRPVLQSYLTKPGDEVAKTKLLRPPHNETDFLFLVFFLKVRVTIARINWTAFQTLLGSTRCGIGWMQRTLNKDS